MEIHLTPGAWPKQIKELSDLPDWAREGLRGAVHAYACTLLAASVCALPPEISASQYRELTEKITKITYYGKEMQLEMDGENRLNLYEKM